MSARCDVCLLPDLHHGHGDGIGSCDCPRCECGVAQWSDLCTCPPDDDQPWPDSAVEEPTCKHCGRGVINKSEPNMGGPPHDNWVHDPGGFSVCYPQQGAASPRATPTA